MNTHQTTQNNPIPLIKPQPPLPILIDGVTFSYRSAGSSCFHIQSGIISINVNDLEFSRSTVFDDSNYVHAMKKNDYREDDMMIIADISDNQRELLEMWIDRCKGVTL